MTDPISAATAARAPERPTAGAGDDTPRAGTSDSAVLSSDFETFLRMLTAQVQNQDPLNPLDSTDFAVQLATFSSVEQQVRTNTLLTQLGETLGGSGGDLSTMAGYVGMEALVQGPAMFDGAPISLETPALSGARYAELRVYDEAGALVHRAQADIAGGAASWDGRAAGGTTAAPGTYSFEVLAFDGERRVIERQPAQVFVPISEVRRGEEALELKLASGAIVTQEDIGALRDG